MMVSMVVVVVVVWESWVGMVLVVRWMSGVLRGALRLMMYK